MANTIRDYSATPANNTVVDGADISEGCSPAGINDAIRGVMSDLKDVSTGAVALESPAFDSASLTGDLTFGDNDKAIFGAGSDLQIYHSGNDSYILDSGTGDLYLAGENNVRITSNTGLEAMATLTANGAVTLYHDNAAKLATTATGVSVTGTVAATSFTGNGSALTGIQSGGLTSQQVFSSSGTWTKPAGISKVKVYVVGGGGGAQCVAGNQAASGGAGGLSIALIDVSSISSASITIGSGGTGSSSSGSRGGNGGTSSFGSYASATGGEGGVSTFAPYDGGEGGTGTTSVTSPVLSALNTRGNGGSRTGSVNVQQSGGGSFFGGAGAGAHDTGSTASQGQAGTHGGGAGMSQYSVAIAGGSGLVVIEEYA